MPGQIPAHLRRIEPVRPRGQGIAAARRGLDGIALLAQLVDGLPDGGRVTPSCRQICSPETGSPAVSSRDKTSSFVILFNSSLIFCLTCCIVNLLLKIGLQKENPIMQHRKTLMLVLTALFAALTAVGAFFKIPFALAAISLQFLFTAMAGILLGAGYGALSQLVYVLIGLVGVPIFALGGGFSYVLQPTFGFLLGLIPSAFVIGKLAKRPLTFWRTALAMLAGLAVLYAVGVPYLALIANAYLGKGLTFWQVLKNGMLIYLPGDLLKIAFGSFLCVAITRRLPQLFAAPQAE
ncbi:MAG: biotin transporter BioY [Christensenellales bacterium]